MPHKDPEAHKAYHAAYRAARREKARLYAQAWYGVNRDRRLAYNAERRDYVRAYDASRRAADPEKTRASAIASSSKRRRAPGGLSTADVQGIKAMGDGVCAYCLRLSEALEIEHCTPLARGGWNTPDNCVMACRPCNARKHTRTVLEFLLDG